MGRPDVELTQPITSNPGAFERFWTGSTISAAGTALTSVAIPIIAVQYLAATPAQMGVLFAAASASSLLVRLPAASWADRSPRRLAIVAVGQLLSGLVVLSLPLLWTGSALTYVALLAVMAGLAACGAVTEAFAAPTVPLLVSRDALAGAFGRFTASRGVADIVGPSLGGLLLQFLAAPLLLVFDALSFFIAALLTRSVRVVATAEPPAMARSAKGELSAVLRDGFLRNALVIIGIASLANGAVTALIVLFMVRELGLAPSVVGLVLGAGAFGGVLAGIAIGSVLRVLGIHRTAVLGGVLMIGSLVGLPLAGADWTGLAACLLYELVGSFGAGVMVITVVSQIPARIASTAIARGIAIANLVPEVAATIGALAGGALASATSVRSTLWSSVAFAVLAGVATLVLTMTLRRRATHG